MLHEKHQHPSESIVGRWQTIARAINPPCHNNKPCAGTKTKNILNSKVARANDDSVDKNNLRDFTIIIKLKAITGTNE